MAKCNYQLNETRPLTPKNSIMSINVAAAPSGRKKKSWQNI